MLHCIKSRKLCLVRVFPGWVAQQKFERMLGRTARPFSAHATKAHALTAEFNTAPGIARIMASDAARLRAVH